MADAQKPDFVFRLNGRDHLNRPGASVQSTTGSRGVRISGSNAGYTTCSEVVWRVLETHSIRQFPLHFPSRASPCAITFQLESTSRLLDIASKALLSRSLPYLFRRSSPLRHLTASGGFCHFNLYNNHNFHSGSEHTRRIFAVWGGKWSECQLVLGSENTWSLAYISTSRGTRQN